MKQYGRYEILGEIGAGAMGAVFKARDPVMDRVVAVKTVHASALTGPMGDQYRERFTREARAAGRLAHPGIVTVFDAGVEGDTPYLVMEFVPGRSLEALLSTEQLPLERIYEIGQQLAEALSYAHANGVIHRDIKPANIQLTGTPERAKIMDFGVAKLTQAQVTTTGTLLGTPSYMAPEQFTGSAVDGRSDLFSLGVILYWMATGDKPFGGDTITAVSYKIVHTEPISPRQLNPSVPAALEAVIVKCLSKDPATRYQTGDELAADLAALRAGTTGSGIRAAAPANATVRPSETISNAVTMPLGSSASMRQSAIGAALTPPQAPAGGPPAPPSAAAPAARAPSAPPLAPRATPAPEPKKSSKVWLYGAAAIIVVGLLWGAGAAKKKREEDAASQAIQHAVEQQVAQAVQQALPAAAPPADSTPASASTPAPSTPTPPPAEAKPVPSPAKHAAATAAAAAPVLPDVSSFPLRLEITADAPASVEITTDDNPAQTYSLKSGGATRAGAQKIFQVRTDNAGALHLKLNDQDMPDLGPAGAPRTVRYTAKNLAASGSSAAAPAGSRRGAAKTQLDIEAANVPKFADFSVSVDGTVIFDRPGILQSGAEPISHTEAIAPGTHTVSVFVGNKKTAKGVRHEVTGDFSAGQTGTVRVQGHFEGRRGPGMLMFDLSLE